MSQTGKKSISSLMDRKREKRKKKEESEEERKSRTPKKPVVKQKRAPREEKKEKKQGKHSLRKGNLPPFFPPRETKVRKVYPPVFQPPFPLQLPNPTVLHSLTGVLRLLILGDLHFKTSNVPEMQEMTAKIITLIKQEMLNSLDYIILLGDTLDTHESGNECPFNLAGDFIEELTLLKPVFLLIGNHDLRNNSSFLTRNHFFNPYKKWPNLTVVDKVHTALFKGIRLTFVPYVPPGRFMEALETSEHALTDTAFIFSHQEFRGCKMEQITSHNGDDWDEKLPCVISGHIHDRQFLGKNIYYTGTPHQTSFGCATQKFITLLTISPPPFDQKERKEEGKEEKEKEREKKEGERGEKEERERKERKEEGNMREEGKEKEKEEKETLKALGKAELTLIDLQLRRKVTVHTDFAECFGTKGELRKEESSSEDDMDEEKKRKAPIILERIPQNAIVRVVFVGTESEKSAAKKSHLMRVELPSLGVKKIAYKTKREKVSRLPSAGKENQNPFSSGSSTKRRGGRNYLTVLAANCAAAGLTPLFTDIFGKIISDSPRAFRQEVKLEKKLENSGATNSPPRQTKQSPIPENKGEKKFSPPPSTKKPRKITIV